VGCSSFTQIGTSPTTTFANTGLTASMSYSYRVRATDAAGNLSGYSNTATAVTSVADPSFSNVVLLMGFEGVNGSTGAPGMNDESPSAHGTAVIGTSTTISTAQFKAGVSSLNLAATSSFIDFPDSLDWTLSTANSSQFTIETFIRFSSITASLRAIIGQWGTIGNRSWALELTSSDTTNLTFSFSTDGTAITTVTTSGAALVVNTWYHLAVDKDATGKIRIYRNGVMVGSATPANSAFFNSTTAMGPGLATGGASAMNGWFDELRITKGVARYASDTGFTVPTVPFPRH
jgi:hypothetical protein